MAINFYSENVSVPSFLRRVVRSWVDEVAAGYGRKIGDISYLFCDNARMVEMNRTYLGHDYATDIITFEQESGSEALFADILISIDQVALNAADYDTTYEEELMRVMIHGILHMCGFDDHTEEDQAAMRTAEDRALAQLPSSVWRK